MIPDDVIEAMRGKMPDGPPGYESTADDRELVMAVLGAAKAHGWVLTNPKLERKAAERLVNRIFGSGRRTA